MDLLQDKVLQINGKGKVNAQEAVQNKLLGLFFSAGWSPPCLKFVPKLKALHAELQRRQAPFEVMFVSCDKTEEEMQEYVEELHGNWLVVPPTDSLAQDLREKYNVTVVPKLLVVNPNGDIVTKKGRKEVEDRGVAVFRTWLSAADACMSDAYLKLPVSVRSDVIDTLDSDHTSVAIQDKPDSHQVVGNATSAHTSTTLISGTSPSKG